MSSISLPPGSIHALPKNIDAACYNAVHLALKRHRAPLRVELPHHRGLEMLLEEQVWLCVDAFHADQPIMAWHDFQVGGRQTLHAPILCELLLYHIHAGLVMGSALVALQQALNELRRRDNEK